MVLANRLADNLADRQSGRERGERILEDNLHLHAELIQLVLRNVVDFFTVEQHLSGGLAAV